MAATIGSISVTVFVNNLEPARAAVLSIRITLWLLQSKQQRLASGTKIAIQSPLKLSPTAILL
jgi:hypothetical protein